MKTDISLAMIVRNEEKYLARCLESVKEYVDEIIIVDTGSADKTMEIANRYTKNLFQYKWNNDFAMARNYAISLCKGNWILSLDADEVLQANGLTLYDIIKDTKKDAFFLPLICPGSSSDSPSEYFIVLRLFRNCNEHRFHGRIHEQIYFQNANNIGMLDKPIIVHNPVSHKERNKRRNRNLKMLYQAIQEDANNSALKYYCAIEWYGLGRYEKALELFAQLDCNLPDFLKALAVKYRIDCLKGLGRHDEALCLCMEQSIVYPDYSDLYFEGGVLFLERQKYDTAIKWLKIAIEKGIPPAQFSHTKGTAGYLALYYVGYSLEKLGRITEAQSYYEQSLKEEPNFLLPLPNVFFYQLQQKNGIEVWNYFINHGYSSNQLRLEALAELFYNFGYVDLAARCLLLIENIDKKDLMRLIHFLTFSSNPAKAINYANVLKNKGMIIRENEIVDEVIALFLLGRVKEAKNKILILWKDVAGRSKALALYLLYGKFVGKESLRALEPNRQYDVMNTLLYILDSCYQAVPDSYEAINCLEILTIKCLNCFKDSSMFQSKPLNEFWENKKKNSKVLMNIQFGNSESLSFNAKGRFK